MPNLRYRQGKRNPEVASCKTSSVGAVIPGTSVEMFYCALDNADCRFAMPVGYDYICKHTKNRSFTTSDDH